MLTLLEKSAWAMAGAIRVPKGKPMADVTTTKQLPSGIRKKHWQPQ
ncbi:MAG TPA: hypothetical protein VLX32_12080 [Candidatus Acidoferrum sp.]|nr:hypothetical protein [Candidatus Acidoferrum sp.]